MDNYGNFGIIHIAVLFVASSIIAIQACNKRHMILEGFYFTKNNRTRLKQKV